MSKLQFLSVAGVLAGSLTGLVSAMPKDMDQCHLVTYTSTGHYEWSPDSGSQAMTWDDWQKSSKVSPQSASGWDDWSGKTAVGPASADPTATWDDWNNKQKDPAKTQTPAGWGDWNGHGVNPASTGTSKGPWTSGYYSSSYSSYWTSSSTGYVNPTSAPYTSTVTTTGTTTMTTTTTTSASTTSAAQTAGPFNIVASGAGLSRRDITNGSYLAFDNTTALLVSDQARAAPFFFDSNGVLSSGSIPVGTFTLATEALKLLFSPAGKWSFDFNANKFNYDAAVGFCVFNSTAVYAVFGTNTPVGCSPIILTTPNAQSLFNFGSGSATTTITTTTTSTTVFSTLTTSTTTTGTTSSTTAATTTVGAATSYESIVVAHHNVHRANHSAPDIVWSDSLAATAQKIGQSCVYAHDVSTDGGGYGQNIAAGVDANGVSFVITGLFYNGEVNNFNGLYGQSNPTMDPNHEWGHFSQVVWKGSTSVGCATVDCSASGLSGAPGASPYFTVCNYAPPGNVQGLYADNVGASLNFPSVDASYGIPNYTGPR